MFVAELDRPWLGTPFLLQGFEIRSKSQIRSLSDYCQHVYVLKAGVPRQAPGGAGLQHGATAQAKCWSPAAGQAARTRKTPALCQEDRGEIAAAP
ncbi:MAG: DUF3391 domain-containing protein [Gammaproteobacteria bacterium]|nr:DUF3391 domain-containing protein [Gammaproteobacteria bacterium]